MLSLVFLRPILIRGFADQLFSGLAKPLIHLAKSHQITLVGAVIIM